MFRNLGFGVLGLGLRVFGGYKGLGFESLGFGARA